jgi:hypothetical protein
LDGQQIPKPASGESAAGSLDSGAILGTRLSKLENRAAEIENQLKTIKDNQPSKVSLWLGVVGGLIGLIAGLTSIPKNYKESKQAINPRQTTVIWGQEIEIAYSPNQLAFTLDLSANNDGDETDQIDSLSFELKSPQLPDPVFITRDDIRSVGPSQTVSNVAFKTPVFVVAKQPANLRIAVVVTASSNAVLSNPEPQTLRGNLTLKHGRPISTQYCIPALDDEDRKALREGKPRRVLIGTAVRTYARAGDIAEGVKVADPSGTLVLNLKPGVPPSDQGENLVVFFNDARRHYEVVPIKHSCGPPNIGWVRLEEKEK